MIPVVDISDTSEPEEPKLHNFEMDIVHLTGNIKSTTIKKKIFLK